MTLSAALLEHWVFGAFLCKFVNFTPTLTALVSTFTVAIIAVERWFFIVNKKKFDRRCTIVILVLLWIVSILIALPEFISRELQEFAPPPIPLSMLKMNSFPTSPNHTQYYLSKPPCHMKKIYFCVLNPGLRMRIFSYLVITVQYLVPFLFVSISCYSISRFLKRRMKQMRVYQTQRPAKRTDTIERESKRTLPKSNSHMDELTEIEYPSDEELPVAIVSNESKPSPLMTRFRHVFQSAAVLDKQNYRSSSIVGTVLMPTAKSQSHSERRFHRSRKLLICVAALFTISWLPLTITQIYLEHHQEVGRDEPNFVYAVLLIPCYLISSLSAWMNPVIYNYINRSFRREFYALYPCCCRIKASDAARTDTPASPVNRSPGQKAANMQDNATVVLSRPINKAGTRLVTFADGDKNGKAAVVVINEHA